MHEEFVLGLGHEKHDDQFQKFESFKPYVTDFSQTIFSNYTVAALVIGKYMKQTVSTGHPYFECFSDGRFLC